MLHFGNIQDRRAASKRVSLDDQPHSRGFATKTDILVSDQAHQPAPQAFLIEQSADSIGGAHFHDQDQFQVIVAGGGALGRHPVQPYTVHYAGRYTGYGPLVAGGEGLSYLTLRAALGSPPLWLPEQKNLMQDGPRCNLTSHALAASDANPEANAGANLDKVSVDVMIEPRDDGIAAWMLRLPANHVAPPPSHARGGGQFRVVVGGAMRLGEAQLDRLGCAYITPQESDAAISSAGNGLEVLVLQFPGQ